MRQGKDKGIEKLKRKANKKVINSSDDTLFLVDEIREIGQSLRNLQLLTLTTFLLVPPRVKN